MHNELIRQGHTGNTTTIYPLPDGCLRYTEDFLLKTAPVLAWLKDNLAWYQGDVRLFGNTYKTPRLQCWYGDKAYTYSQTKLPPTPWPELLFQLKTAVEEATGTPLNSILGNWYRDGADHMGMHADNEPELGKNPTVAMVTLGESRTLQFRHRNRHDRFSITPADGSLLIMEGSIQHHWRHGINKSKKVSGERISLTFRQIISPGK